MKKVKYFEAIFGPKMQSIMKVQKGSMRSKKV